MYSENKEKRRNTRSPEDVLSPAASIITSVEQDDVDDDGPEVDPKIGHTQEEIEQKAIEALKEIGYPNPTDSEIQRFYDSNVHFDYSDRGERSPAFDYKNVFGTTIITINTSHKLYTSFLESVYTDKDAQTTFELFIAALVLSVQKVSSYSQENAAAMDSLLTTMYTRLNRYIQQQLNPGN